MRSSRVVMNRKAVNLIRLAAADGCFAVAKAVITRARPPDAPPYGEGLIEGGGAIVWVDKRKIDGTLIGGRQITKPRAVRLGQDEIVAIAGWGFPARFVNNGTEDTAADPFFSKVVAEVEGDAASIFQRAASYRIARARG